MNKYDFVTTEKIHCGGDLYDAVEAPSEYLAAAVAAGYKSVIAVGNASFTHMQNTLNGAEALRKEGTPMKIIYGVDAYVELPPFAIEEVQAKLTLLAVDNSGKKIIDHLVSRANVYNGRATIDWQTLQGTAFDGHVIALTSGVNGLVAMRLRANELCEAQRAKIQQLLDEADACKHVPLKAALLHSYVAPDANAVTVASILAGAYATMATQTGKKLTASKNAAKKVSNDLAKAKAEGNLSETMRLQGELGALQKEQATLQKEKDSQDAFKKEASSNQKSLEKRVDAYHTLVEKIEAAKRDMLPEDELKNSALIMATTLQKLFGKDNFYLELQYHYTDVEAQVMPMIADIAKRMGVGTQIIASNDAYMPTNTARSIHRRQLAKFLRFRKDSIAGNWTTYDEHSYIKSPDALAEALMQILPEETVAEAMKNLQSIGDRIDYEPAKDRDHYPVYDRKHESNSLLRETTEKLIETRFPGKRGWTKEYADRLKYELDIIIRMGYADYFLIVKDFLEFARWAGYIPVEYLDEVPRPLSIEGVKAFVKEHGWTVGCGCGLGRGSAAGSLVAYILGITHVDPIVFKLSFERFLNPGRVTMPDIDSDIANGIRDLTVEYCRDKYGHNAVVGIIAESHLGAKAALQQAGSYVGAELYGDNKRFMDLRQELSNVIPKLPAGITLQTPVTTEDGEEAKETYYELLRRTYADNADAMRIIELANDAEGILYTYTQHAAGNIIFDCDDINSYISTRMLVRKNKPSVVVTEMDHDLCEAMGMLKMDFLGLRTLNIESDTLRFIKELDGIELDLLVDADPNGEDAAYVFEHIFRCKNTDNVFQFASPGMKKYLGLLQPTCVDDLIAMNALYRPGPMDSIPDFIEAKKSSVKKEKA